MFAFQKKHEAIFSRYPSQATFSKEERNEEPMIFSLMNLTDCIPIMPNPWSGSDAGEGWIWGDYIITFQKEPHEGYSSEYGIVAMKYPYAMTVFYNPANNPHYPSYCPILVLSLEQAIEKLHFFSLKNPYFIGMFHRGGFVHTNLGKYVGTLESESVKLAFFDILRSYLHQEGDPQPIGNFKDTTQYIKAQIKMALEKEQYNEELSDEDRAGSTLLLGFTKKMDDLINGKLSKEEAEEFDNELASLIQKEYNQESMSIFEWPSMPACFSSIDEGEVWDDGEYLYLFQKEPKTVLEIFYKDQHDGEITPPMLYHFAMVVLPKYITNTPEEPRPVLVAGLEQLPQGIFDEEATVYLGVFFNNGRRNYGKYEGSYDPDIVRLKFFEKARELLSPMNQPVKIGTIVELFPASYGSVTKRV